MATTNYAVRYGTLQTAVASGGTIVLPFPPGSALANFSSGQYTGLGTIIINQDDAYTEAAGKVSFAYAAGGITVTNNSGVAWNVGDRLDYGMGASNFNYNFSGKTTPASAVTDIPSVVAALKTAGILY